MATCDLRNVLLEYEKFIEWDYEFIYTAKKEKFLVKLTPDMSQFYHLAGFQYFVTDTKKKFKKETWLELIRNGKLCYSDIGRFCMKNKEVHIKTRMNILHELNDLILNPGISFKVVYTNTEAYHRDNLYSSSQILLFFEPNKIICLSNNEVIHEDEILSWRSDPMRLIRKSPNFFLRSIRSGNKPPFKDVKLVYLAKSLKNTTTKEIIFNELNDLQGDVNTMSGYDIVNCYNSLLNYLTKNCVEQQVNSNLK